MPDPCVCDTLRHVEERHRTIGGVKKLWVLRGRFDVIYFARGDPGSRLAQG